MTSKDDRTERSAGLADPSDARSNCGVGMVMDLETGGGHWVVADGLELLERLEHRGATGAETETGDGAGIVLQRPDALFRDVVDVPLDEEYAVGSLFFPSDPSTHDVLRTLVETVFEEQGLSVAAWRTVPTGDVELGRTARDSEPAVVQCFVEAGAAISDEDGIDLDAFDRRLYVARRALESTIDREQPPGYERFYVCSLDRRTVVYKGLLKGTQLSRYFPDLQDRRTRSSFVLVHARFSTNTLGAWHLAHPYRTIVHNGEFNTIQGNQNWMFARETDLECEAFDDADLDRIRPVITDTDQSDTASVDDAVELLCHAGRDLPHVLRMLVPEAWRGDDRMSETRKAWYDFHASLVEPWDGPALVCGTDGTRVAAVLDRNGLRPCRYDRTEDGTVVLASEVGALDLDPDEVVERGRLQPGELFLADAEAGRIVPDEEVFKALTDRKYADWIETEQVQLETLLQEEPGKGDAPSGTPGVDPGENDPPSGASEGGSDGGQAASGSPCSGRTNARSSSVRSAGGWDPSLRSRQVAFGYSHDELETLLQPMYEQGSDPIGSMGDDTPLSVLSAYDRPLASFFKQLFAQVTNPPLDYIREEVVTSLETRLGHQRNLLDESPQHANQLIAESPVLSERELEAIVDLDRAGLTSAVVDITYSPDVGLETAIERVRTDAVTAIRNGADVVVLSDRAVEAERVAIPSLLATGAVHHYLVRIGIRNHAGLVVDSGGARTVHQVATLIGYGAGAVCPHLAYETIRDLVAGEDGADPAEAIDSYVGALEDGLLKTMAKMGISTVESYQGAQIFEAVGLADEVVEEYFEGTEHRTGGIDIDGIERAVLGRHEAAWNDDPQLERYGEFEHRSDGITHQWNPETVGALHRAVRRNDIDAYEEFAGAINDSADTLRGLLTFRTDDRESIPLEAVEPVESIVTRFSTAAMSLGSLSPEAHENNAIAMNRIGGSANTGEGGEPPERFGTDRECSVKQVASGRFGVTAEYLAAADELQIKMAQGSKPGEGGHLPGGKVNEMIADVRHATPGVGLISPPPLHDIYSIEDLKQLIYDLSSANPKADVNVKLVSEAGIGTIAAGVAKANADVIHISGHSGGTGASPRTSIKHAGVPWELGLAEANQLLVETDLRDRVRLSVDGGLKTGRDVAVAALLGAEEFVFGTASLVSSGCVMARQCHANTCPVGVATQDEDLRDRFPGEPHHVVNYLRFIALELREIMADLGVETVDELVGRPDLLRQREAVDHPTANRVDLSGVLATPSGEQRRKVREQDHELDDRLDEDLIDAAKDAIGSGTPTTIDATVTNADRAVGATLSNAVVSEHGGAGLPDDTIAVDARGTAGQSFGAFLAGGITLRLAGAANDYVGKGLSGGRIVVSTPAEAGYDPTENVAIGNVALYGATDGECYVNGVAGERFAVRNSGAKAVVEGLGDHGCEYMTGGIVAVLGSVGRNFAAGMSGGIAYVLEDDSHLERVANTGMISIDRTLDDHDRAMLRRLIENHAEYTDSERARQLLTNWEATVDRFSVVIPDPYDRVLTERDVEDVRFDLPAPAAGDGTDRTDVATGDD